MRSQTGVYGPDDVSWEIQDARDRASDEAYRRNKNAIDAQDRLTAKRSLLAAKEDVSAVYQSAHNGLFIAYEREGRLVVYAAIYPSQRLVRFMPLEVAGYPLVRWCELSQLDIWKWNMIAPKGCI